MRKLFDVLRTFDDGDKLTLINTSHRGEGIMTGAVSSCPPEYGNCKVERVKTYKDNLGLPVHKVYIVAEDEVCDPYAEHERLQIYERCRDCVYLVADDEGNWVCDDCGRKCIDIADEDCSANQNW